MINQIITTTQQNHQELSCSIEFYFSHFIYYIILARTVPQDEIGKFFFVLSIVSIISLFSDLVLGT